ncbi:MAG: ABC transporter permease [Clostridiales bacterium]|nr:ABC transporter permease [Clostridiales bacterium]
MKLFLNRLYVCAKRSLKNPYVYGMAAIIIILAFLSAFMPAKESSAYIPVAILNLDDSEETSKAVDELCEMGSIFNFYEVETEDSMYADMARGACNTGFILPEDMMAKSGSMRTVPDIRVITTASSTLPLMSSEEVFMKLFPYFAQHILEDTVRRSDVSFPDNYETSMRRIFTAYMEGSEIYRLESLENTEYNDITNYDKLIIPVYKFAGFFIWMAALLGAFSYLSDSDNKLYLRMSRVSSMFMGLILSFVHVLPVALISIIGFLIADVDFSLSHVLIYCVVVILLSFVIAVIFSVLPGQGRKSKVFSSVLPTYLILSFLFGGVLINLSVYSPLLRTVSMLFPPYFF